MFRGTVSLTSAMMNGNEDVNSITVFGRGRFRCAVKEALFLLSRQQSARLGHTSNTCKLDRRGVGESCHRDGPSCFHLHQ